jgi:hypothetical protein
VIHKGETNLTATDPWTNEYLKARAYRELCERAAALGIPTSLDDPASPRTVAALERAVYDREKADHDAEEIADAEHEDAYEPPTEAA